MKLTYKQKVILYIVIVLFIIISLLVNSLVYNNDFLDLKTLRNMQ